LSLVGHSQFYAANCYAGPGKIYLNFLLIGYVHIWCTERFGVGVNDLMITGRYS